MTEILTGLFNLAVVVAVFYGFYRLVKYRQAKSEAKRDGGDPASGAGGGSGGSHEQHRK